MRPCLALLGLALALAGAAPLQADIYRARAADGTLTFTNVYQAGRGYVRVMRTPRPAPRPATAAAPPHAARLPSGSVPGALPYARQVAAAASAHQLPEALLHAVIHSESNYNPLAISRRGAIGLMQLMPDTARELGVADPWDPAANINGGARYLRQLLQLFDNDLPLALAAYNAGPGAVLRQGRAIPPYAETRAYVPRVIQRYQHLQSR